jgi:hypothetical protein
LRHWKRKTVFTAEHAEKAEQKPHSFYSPSPRFSALFAASSVKRFLSTSS